MPVEVLVFVAGESNSTTAVIFKVKLKAEELIGMNNSFSYTASNYVMMVIFFFSSSVVNNYALNFNVPLPLHMIFRSGSLVANLVLGMIILKKRYNFSKYISVLMITVGICLCTLASANKLLAGFLLLYKDILRHFSIFNSSAPLILLDSSIQVPKLWAYLAGNIVTQYICIRSVYILTSECTSLTVTLVVTLRKFTSLMFSIFYFKNPFTLYHWCGTVLVFGGTLIFVELAKKIREALVPQKETKVD
ncbi:UDP-xylose and UDP-N-acetylglucosamine transporter-like [Stylophora pistillata]|uniref:UDP-xylose and UDP-N-acetylglucosamine transporter-like n=1 Tax=Stylophora pistillata TaxID=50429 RepID=UPI000C053014|nr:UDP-xylose and UDP-N-acetylglucosamine transporter-like [Stylophora pistillata]